MTPECVSSTPAPGAHQPVFRAKLNVMDNNNATALERAFSLARSGACTTVGEIRVALKAEGYTTEQITGSALSRQLKALIDEHKAQRRGAPGLRPDRVRRLSHLRGRT